MDFMHKIENLRERMGISQTDIAKLLEINKTSYSNYKRYDRVLPLKHLNKLANFFDVSIDYLFGLSDIKKYNNYKKEININIFTIRFKEFRNEHKITQEKLSQILKTSQSTLSAYEKGETLILTSFLYEICKKYKISADYLLGKIDEPKYLN